MNKSGKNRIFLYGLLVLFCVLYWCLDSAWSFVSSEPNLNSLVEMAPGSFLDAFFLKVSLYQAVSRIVTMFLLLLSGILLIECSRGKKKVAHALLESEKRYQYLMNQVDVGTCILQNERIILPNLKLQEITGYSQAELENLKFTDIVHPDDMENLQDADIAGISDVKPIVGASLQILGKEGKTQDLYQNVTSIVWQGEPGQLSVLHDVSNQKTKEDKAQQPKKMEAIGLLAGGVAHDLNNILAGIVSYPELLLQMLPPDSPLCSHVETMYDTGLRASAVVSDFLTVVRGVGGTRHLLDLNVLAESSLRTPDCQILKERHPGIQLSSSFYGGPVTVLCSEMHIQKSIMNLLFNAFEAIDQGSGNVFLSTDKQNLSEREGEILNLKAGQYAVLSVVDSGSRITEEQKEHIFEPFYTRKTMGRNSTGLGLTLVWNAIMEHNGAIDIKTSDEGTRFSFYLELAQIPLAEEENAA